MSHPERTVKRVKLTNIFYTVIGWLNFPSISTPLGQRNLRHMDNGILQCAQYILALSQDKAEKSDMDTMVQSVTLDPKSGILAVTQRNGSTKTYDLAIEKVVANFYITDDNELVLILDDGTEQTIDLTRFVYDVDSTATISMKIENRVITAEIIDGSVTMDKLEKSIMQTLRQYMLDAQAAAEAAANYNTAAESWAHGGTGARPGERTDNSKYYSEIAKQEAEKAASYSDMEFPEFYMDYLTGHLFCKQGKNVEFYLDENMHMIAEVA